MSSHPANPALLSSKLIPPCLSQADDELESPYLAGFEWDKEESWTRLVVHLQKQPGTGGFGGSKKKKKTKEDEE